MIITPRNQYEWAEMAKFLYEYAHVEPSPNLRMIGWTDETDAIRCIVALNSFLGKLAQIHVAYHPGWHYTPRALLRAVFRYAFIDCKLKLLLGLVNGNNDKALTFDKHLGFRELYRMPQMHDDDGDLVVLGMYPDDCQFLDIEDKSKRSNADGRLNYAIS